MMQRHGDFNDDIEWGVYKKQQTIPASVQNAEEPEDESRMDVPLGKGSSEEGETVDTFLGRMPSHDPSFKIGTPENKELLGEAIGAAAMALPVTRGISKVGKAAKPLIKKGIDYLHPERAAENFRSMMGSGTSKENIAEMSKRAQFASKSAKEEALIPKDELYAQEGKSNVYNVGQHNLPEGNIGKFAETIAPGENFGTSEANALSKALSKYRKTGNIDHFNETAEDIFKIPELGEKAAKKVEDMLSLPVKRDSAYFADSDVTMPYSKKGKIMTLHNEYQSQPTLNNYQDLRSAITTQMRKLKSRAKTDELASEKYDQMKMNLSNLDKDASQFIETLPENMRNLDSTFRQKYARYAETYAKGEKETGASLTLRRLAEGRHDLVTDNQIVRLFSNPTKADQKAILDMGEGAARNAIYSALQRVPVGDAEGMAKTIIDLKRTKGFDKIITPHMEEWAANMLTQVRRSGMIKKSLGSAGGMALGGALGGPVGAAVGAALPWGKEFGSAWSKILASKLKK